MQHESAVLLYCLLLVVLNDTSLLYSYFGFVNLDLVVVPRHVVCISTSSLARLYPVSTEPSVLRKPVCPYFANLEHSKFAQLS